MLDEPRRKALLGGERRKRGVRNLQLVAMLIPPSRVKSFRVAIEAKRHAAFARGRAKAIIAADLTDPTDCRQFEPGFAGIAKELQRARADHRVLGDLFGGLEIAFEAGVVEELDGANVRKAFAAGRVADEFPVEVQVQAG